MEIEILIQFMAGRDKEYLSLLVFVCFRKRDEKRDREKNNWLKLG